MEKREFKVEKGAVIHFTGFWLEVDKEDTTKCCLYSKNTNRIAIFSDLQSHGKMRDIKNYFQSKLYYNMFCFHDMSKENILLLVDLMRLPHFRLSVRGWEYSHNYGGCKVYKKGDSQRMVDESGKLVLDIQ